MARAGFVAIIILACFNLIALPSSCAADEQSPLPYSTFKPVPGYGGFDNANERQPFVQRQPVDKPQLPPSKDDKKPKNPKKSKLVEGFYNDSCPNAEQIVADELAQIVKTNPGAIAALIRLQFHDCFVGGCDASILLDSVASGDTVEKASMSNGELLKGTDVIDDIKAKLEEECPGVVSCADTLAFATAEAMVLGGLPRHPKLGGRRDGLTSLAAIAEENLPFPNWSVDQMVGLFESKGFSAEDLVVLSGAHSVGSAHCAVFSDRIFNYRNTGRADPVLGGGVVDELKKICKAPGTTEARGNPVVSFDETPTVLDNLFFKNLVEKKKALLATDQALARDKRTAPFVKSMAADPNLFPEKFGEVMTRLASLDVLTGNKGEVRTSCRSST